MLHAHHKAPVVLGLGGSLRTTSRTANALRVALRGAGIAGAHPYLLGLKDMGLPFFSE